MSGLLNSSLNEPNASLPDSSARPFGSSFSAQSASATPGFHHAVQGLHNIHGSFNIPNMPGSLTSRNSTMNGVPSSAVQQPTGSLSNGRFTSNNIPVALSQISHGSTLGHSGATNRGGMGVSPILGNSGPRITSSIGNIVGSGNIGRNLSSGGGLSMPGLASRLNLSANSGSGNVSVQGPNRLMGGVHPQAPQVMSMLGNSYSGGPISQSQAGNNSLNSMGMLGDLGSNENAPFDINDFPRLSGRPGSAGGPQGQLGSMRKQGVSSIVQQNQEFSIQNEDFPALPGFKGGSGTEFSMDLHQKEQQLHDNTVSMMQSQHFPMGRSAGFLGGSYSSHRQQQQQHGPSVGHASNQDLLHLHGSDLFPSSHSNYHSQVQNGGLGLRAVNNLNSYDQLIQQYPQLQPQFRLQQMSAVNQSYRDQNIKSLQNPHDLFGLLGLLSVIRMSDPDVTSLALGIDLTTLGLNLNSGEDLHKKFMSPWSDGSAKGGGPEYRVPECYYAKQPPVLHQGYFSKFKLQTLFYIFYSMPKDEAQLYAANELCGRGWFYHKEHKIWLTRAANTEPLVKSNTYERASYLCFDPSIWETVRKDNFVLHYESVEKRPVIPQH